MRVDSFPPYLAELWLERSAMPDASIDPSEPVSFAGIVMTAKIPWTARAFLSVEETAVLLGLSRSTLYRSLQRGDFPVPAVQVNGRIRVPRKAVERLIEGSNSPL